eukprot:NODE_1165_length_1626_cov_31.177452_g1096_i0.p1 GENE.NODE_1165_length_1626_cov_31.177452_g1096_i0~~NODE_1165_length_1626_cov_31.177452_g1096_i0.p1  ORF type:complete len:537 (+),score=140.35 NODE_1165_length_1626_cov_31.177452_g1096_i0:33-1613(+)
MLCFCPCPLIFGPPFSPSLPTGDDDQFEKDTTIGIDEALSAIGLGRAQYLVCTAMLLSHLAMGMQIINMVFTQQPAVILCHNCTDINTADELEICQMSSPRYEHQVPSIAAEWNLVCSQQWKLQFASMAFFAGFWVGVGFFGYLCDKKGRRWTFFCTLSGCLLTSFASAVAPSYLIYLIARAATAACYAGWGLASYVLLVEFLPSQYVAKAAGVCGVMFAVGECLVPLIAYGLPEWRGVICITTLFTVPFAFYFWKCPESPRWLLSTGQHAQAQRVLADVCHVNNIAPLAASLRPCLPTQHPGSLWSIVRHPALLKTMVSQMYLWFCASFLYYGLSLNVGSLAGGLHLTAFIAAVVEIPSCLAIPFVLDCLGRRRALVLTYQVAGFCCIMFALLPSLPSLATPLAMLGKLAITAAFTGIYVWTAELFPTDVRSVSLGVCSQAARVGGITAPLVLLLSDTTSVPFLIWGLSGLVAALMCLLSRETHKQRRFNTVQEYVCYMHTPELEVCPELCPEQEMEVCPEQEVD